jgi:hypothetical protein
VREKAFMKNADPAVNARRNLLPLSREKVAP